MIPSLTGYRDLATLETRIPVGGARLDGQREDAQRPSPAPPGDDDEGLSLAARRAAQVRGGAQSQKETSDGVSQLQAALTGLTSIHRSLLRLREVSLQAVGGRSREDQQQTRATVHELLLQIDRAADDARCGDAPLLHEPATLLLPSLSIDREARSAAVIELPATDSASLGLLSLRTDSQAAAQAALAKVDSALAMVAAARARVSELHGKLASAHASGSATLVMPPAAEVTPQRILDAPPRSTTAQANQDPQVALALLRG